MKYLIYLPGLYFVIFLGCSGSSTGKQNGPHPIPDVVDPGPVSLDIGRQIDTGMDTLQAKRDAGDLNTDSVSRDTGITPEAYDTHVRTEVKSEDTWSGTQEDTMTDGSDISEDHGLDTGKPDETDTAGKPDIIEKDLVVVDETNHEDQGQGEEVIQNYCGDGVCGPDENCSTCQQDCGCAPDTVCEQGVCKPCSTVCAEAGAQCGEIKGCECGDCPTDYECVQGKCEFSGQCLTVPDPGKASLDPMVSISPPGKTEETTKDGFHDVYLYNSDGSLKVGVRKDWGATIVFFGMTDGKPGINSTNAIDANDTGREVQVAFYDPDRGVQGCAWNASCRTNPSAACPGGIPFLGWDPVQGGNKCNIGSGIESLIAKNGSLVAVTRPLFWNPGWDLQDCSNTVCNDPTRRNRKSDVQYTQVLKFVDPNIVELDMTVTNLADTAHAATAQEFPTLYASFGKRGPNLHVIMDSSGNIIKVDQPANNGFFHKVFTSPGHFAALQNDNHDYGVGLYYENNLTGFSAWQKDGVFNNIRGSFVFGIPAKGWVRARAYIVLGSFNTISQKVTWLKTHIPPFGSLDAPIDDAVQHVGTPMDVRGWVMDNIGVSKVEVLVDGQVVKTVGLQVKRKDVCTAFPGYAMCPNVGFRTKVDVSGLTPCAHLMEVRATDTDGNARVIGRARIWMGHKGCNQDKDCDDNDPCTTDRCESNRCVNTPVPPGEGPKEICNGKDDDCDGETDEGGVCDVTHPVYRFLWQSGKDTDHALSTNKQPQSGYHLEGTAFYLFDSPGDGRIPIYEVYCASCTDHMTTTNKSEGAPAYGGAVLLGYAYDHQTSQANNLAKRFYNTTQSDHLTTTSTSEWSALTQAGWSEEGGFWVP